MPPSSRSPQPAKALLALRDINQTAAARDLGCTPHCIGRVLNGRERPSDDFKARLAEYLDTPAVELFVDNLADVAIALVRRTTEASNVSEVVTDAGAVEQVVAILRNAS